MLDKLKQLGTCSEALVWVESHKDLTSQQLWDICPNGSWLLWLLAKTQADHKKIVLCAARCARLSLQYNSDPRVLTAIETAEAYANDKATVEDCRKAANAANAAAKAAYAAAYAAATAAYAAYAAADAADAAAAANAAGVAAGVAAAYAAAARTTALKQCADIVRELFPDVPVI